MAAGKADNGGSQSFLEALAVPRPASRFLLAIICLGVAQAAWHFLDMKLLAFASGQAVTLCTMCLAAVWGFREKSADILGSNDLDSDELDMARRAANQLGIHSIRRALWVAICLLLAGSAAVASQLSGYVMHWMVIAGGFGVAESLYAFWLTSHLSQQLREWRDTKQIKNRQVTEMQAQLDRFSKSAPVGASDDPNRVDPSVVNGTLIPTD